MSGLRGVVVESGQKRTRELRRDMQCIFFKKKDKRKKRSVKYIYLIGPFSSHSQPFFFMVPCRSLCLSLYFFLNTRRALRKRTLPRLARTRPPGR